MSNIVLKNIDKFYGENQVVHNISLDISEREFVVLVGPSGCGKSTTLRMIAGLEDISGGNLFIGGVKSNNVLPKDRPVAMVFQDYALYPHMTVYDNLSFSLKIKNIKKEIIEQKVQHAASMLDLSDYLDRKPAALSGGQRQRVAMGRAIVKESSIFLFDEPLSNLDAKLRSKMRVEIKKFHIENQATTVYVTHDQLEAMTLADRLVVMKEGLIEQIGTPMEVFEYPRTLFVATFIGSPGMNLFNCVIKKQIDKTFLEQENGIFSFTLPKEKADHVHDQMKVVMGIRPSDIYIADATDEIVKDWKTSGKVVIVELLGKNAFLTIENDSIEFLSEIMGRMMPSIGDSVDLGFNLNHIHLFDPSTGVNLLNLGQ